MTEPDLQPWGNKVRTQDVVGFDVSAKGAIAFRFRRAIQVFTSTFVAPCNALAYVLVSSNFEAETLTIPT